jgi:hypothetical protein
MLTWQTASVIGVEKRLNLVNGLTVVVDETRLVKDPALVDAVLYMIPKNHGRPRGGGWPNMIPWRAVVVSTGEQPAISFTSHQGASARVLSIQSPPFGTDGTTSRNAAETVKAGVEANYGTAGPAFAGRLQASLAEDGGTEKLRGRHQELTEMLRGSTDMTGRRAPLAACLALAAELAAQWGIVPFGAPDVTTWSGLFASDEQRDNRPEMALDLVREYLAARRVDRPRGQGGAGAPAREAPRAAPPARIRTRRRALGMARAVRPAHQWSATARLPHTPADGRAPGTSSGVSPRGHRPRTRGRPVTYTYHAAISSLSQKTAYHPGKRT